MNESPSLESLAIRQPKSVKNMDDFDERAKANSNKVTSLHEFRRKNIESYEPSDENLFNYTAEEADNKYSALKIENLFRFDNTFKAIRWGIMVGALFGTHRFIRSRNYNNAMNWFATVSVISFFNIWISYGIQ